jgi:hypothetical protein
MPERFARYVVAPAIGALLVALGGVSVAEMLQPKDQAPQFQKEPPRFLYIHCATAGGDGPCALDPAMQRLNGDPRLDGPREMPAPAPLLRPDVAPER